MATFKSDANLIRLKNHQVVRFEDGEYEAESNVVANYLRSHPLVEEVVAGKKKAPAAKPKTESKPESKTEPTTAPEAAE